MQFLTKDIAKADAEESPYQYCSGDPVGKVDPSGMFSVEQYLASYWNRLNRLEQRLAKKCWWQLPALRSSADEAFARAQLLFPGLPLFNDEGDAFRHAYWNALLSRMIGSGGAKRWTDAHENGDPKNTRRMKRMDLRNNSIGRDLVRKYPYMSKQQLEQTILQSGRLVWFGHGV